MAQLVFNAATPERALGTGPYRVDFAQHAGGERGACARGPLGTLLGVVILLLTARSLTFIDISGSIVYALVVPYAAIALTLYYFNLQARTVTERGEPTPSPALR
jgi:hypothetical protein